MFTTPILILLGPDAERSHELLESLRPLAPTHLFVTANGSGIDDALGASRDKKARRALMDRVSWTGEVHTLFHHESLSLTDFRLRGMDWFFRQIEGGIIVEPQVTPKREFYERSAELLVHHHKSSSIYNISAPAQRPPRYPEHSYGATQFPQLWAWATWRRVWQTFDPDMAAWPAYARAGRLEKLVPASAQRQLWTKTMETARRRGGALWPCPWLFHLWNHGGSALELYGPMLYHHETLCSPPEQLIHPRRLEPEAGREAEAARLLLESIS